MSEMIDLERKIEKAEQKLLKAKREYDAAIERLHDLLEEKARLAGGLDGGRVSFSDWTCSCEWKGHAVWNDGSGSLNCNYRALIAFRPGESGVSGTEVRNLEMNKPGFTVQDVIAALEKSLYACLDDEFEDYCSEDDYYQPVVEDFEAEWIARKWAEARGLEVISFSGEGSDEGYELKFRKW